MAAGSASVSLSVVMTIFYFEIGKNYSRHFKDTDLFEQMFLHILMECYKFHLVKYLTNFYIKPVNYAVSIICRKISVIIFSYPNIVN